LREAESAIAEEAKRDRLPERLTIPQPKQLPATLDDFYKLIVRAKNETENEPRFSRFLRRQVENEQLKIKEELGRLRQRILLKNVTLPTHAWRKMTERGCFGSIS